MRAHVMGVMLALSCATPAVVLGDATETFTYPTPSLNGAGFATNGWSGGWTAGTRWLVDSGEASITQQDQTTLTGYGDSHARRSVSAPVSGTVYMSWQITPGDMGDPAQTLNNNDSGGAGVVIGFADSDTNIKNNAPIVTTYEWTQKSGGTTYHFTEFAVSMDGTFSNSNTDVFTWTPGQTYQLVGRLEFNQAGSLDRWTVWVNSNSEADAHVGQVSAELGYTGIGMVELYEWAYGYTGAQATTVDNLRIGGTWAGVIPEPTSLMASLVVGAALLRRRR